MTPRPSTDWMISVLQDLAAFARGNGLTAFALGVDDLVAEHHDALMSPYAAEAEPSAGPEGYDGSDR